MSGRGEGRGGERVTTALRLTDGRGCVCPKKLAVIIRRLLCNVGRYVCASYEESQPTGNSSWPCSDRRDSLSRMFFYAVSAAGGCCVNRIVGRDSFADADASPELPGVRFHPHPKLGLGKPARRPLVLEPDIVTVAAGGGGGHARTVESGQASHYNTVS